MRIKHLVAILVLFMVTVTASPAQAGGVVTVCDEPHLLAALAGGGTVTFTCSGTIFLTAEIVIVADATIDGSGQDVTVSGNNAVRVFTVNEGVMLDLNGLTIANGRADAGGGFVTVSNSVFSGNANRDINNSSGTVTKSNSTLNVSRTFQTSGGDIPNFGMLTINIDTFFDHTDFPYGGGINNYGMVTVSNSTFSDNSAVGGGGGIYNNGNATLTTSHTIFSGNFTIYVGGGGIRNNGGTLTVNDNIFSGNGSGADNSWGGGIDNSSGTLVITNSTFSGNWTGAGGGGIASGGTVTVSSSSFSGNQASTDGGGIFSQGSLIVTNSTFSGNAGGIANAGTLSVSNSTFFGNGAYEGGGINNYGLVTVSNSTFSGNSAYQYGGGINNYIGTVTLKNTVVANNLPGGNCAGTISDGGGNLSYPDSTCPGINADPLLGSLQDNGGPTETMALRPDSAAIDAANDATCAAAPVNNFDQRSVTRPQGAHCDIGAFEWVCPSFMPPATVDVEDIVAIATRWGWTDTTPGWNSVYDLNLDSRIDILDIMLVTAAWGYTCS